MKCWLLLLFSCVLSAQFYIAQNVGISENGLSPHPSAGLDVNFDDKGFLPPRVALNSSTDQTTISNPANGLVVFNTMNQNDVSEGLYVWFDSQWNQVILNESTETNWKLDGNEVDASNDFIGTTNNQSVIFKTNDIERFEMDINGSIRSFSNGTASQPIYGFSTQNNTGMFLQNTSDLRFSVAGNSTLQLRNNFIRSFQNHRFPNGNEENPSISFSSSSNTGFFRPSNGAIGVSTNSNERLRITSDGRFGFNNDAPPFMYSFDNDNINIGNGNTLGEFFSNAVEGTALGVINTNPNNGNNSLEVLTAFQGNGSSAILGVHSFDGFLNSQSTGVTGISNSWQGTGVLGRRIDSGGPNFGFGGLFFADLGFTGDILNISDRKLKKDIKEFNNAVEIIEALNPVSYSFETEKYPHFGLTNNREIGFIAQELKEILPELVKTKSLETSSPTRNSNYSTADNFESEEFEMVNYSKLIPILAAAIKEQQEQINILRLEIEALNSN